MRKRHLFITEKRMIPVGKHRIRIRIIHPLSDSPERVPGVLWIHGGGYQSGSSRDVYVTRALSLTVKFGAVLVAPDYRLSRTHPYPAGLHDCYAALLYLRDHAKELGVRDDQIMIGGESAGGGMAAALCLLARDRGEVNIAFQMPLYPMLDDRDTETSRDNHSPNWNTRRNHKAWKRYLQDAWGTDLVSPYAAPARAADLSGLPPFYTYVGETEPFCQETRDYTERLKQSGVEAEADYYGEGWFHAYDVLFPMKKVSREAIGRFEKHFAYAAEHYFAPQKRAAGETPQKTGEAAFDGGIQPEDMVE